jgi:hypothetical protein
VFVLALEIEVEVEVEVGYNVIMNKTQSQKLIFLFFSSFFDGFYI